MSQVAVPFPVATARQAFEEDVPIPDAGPAEVPWRPDPDLALEGSSNGGDPTTGPEHGVPTPPRDAEEVDERRRWYALGALAIILALAIFVAYMAVGNRSRQAEPAPSASSAASAAPTPTSDPSGATASQTPQSSSASASPSPSATAASDTLDLGDASLKVLPGWQVYADEVVQDNRRLVRLKQGDSDSRIQIVTLTSLSGDLKQACADLTTEHRQAYSDVAESATVNVAVADGATGVACGFTGTRTSDKVPVKVDFTIVQRGADKTSIVFRDVIPQSVAADSPIRGELATMECGAANSFGVKITQCASVGKAEG